MPRIPRPPEANVDIRLFDRLRQLDPTIPEMPIIVADEIARQIDALPGTGEASPPADAFGTLVPPFRECFIEADTVLPDVGLVQRGVLVRDLTPDWRAGTLQPLIRERAPAGTTWLISAMGYIRSLALAGGVVHSYDGMMLFHLDAEGHLLDDPEHTQVVTAPLARRPSYTLPAAGLPNHAPYMLKAIGAMHARCAADRVTPERSQRRNAERQGVQRLHDYYILRVQPWTPRDMAGVGRPTKAAGQKREHLVRGHFRYYREDAPMFGRPGAVGMVWIPAHERGDSDIGRIRKDYEVGGDE